ncbi:MAG: nicotinamide-nucleotide amidohydrolase family protein [Pirellulaceae bacterium]|nr:nicotinamide-nucleotide amidohydrolase family protein [Pirellulaceae bacterium]
MSHRAAARRVVNLLERTGLKLAVAESCTGGLVSGALTAIPGVSAVHCGGVITYRNETKSAYLGIPASLLRRPGPVSPEVAERMVMGVLQKTPEAGIGVSVTGHLGPDAPADLDGRVYVAIAERRPRRAVCHELTCAAIEGRTGRQNWVVGQVLKILGEHLELHSNQAG